MSNGQQPSPLSPADNPAVTAHISLLQGIINRLANNSVSCKTWCLTLVGALLSLAGATRAPAIVAFALVPVVVFGFLDTMYLAQERAYRNLYTTVVKAVRDGSYDRTMTYQAQAPLDFAGFCAAFGSWSVFPVYLSLIVAYAIAAYAGWISALIGTAK
jgi:hypothetical protein